MFFKHIYYFIKSLLKVFKRHTGYVQDLFENTKFTTHFYTAN